MGGLQGTDVRDPHWTQHVPWGKASKCGGEPASDVGEVHADGDGGGGQRGLQD